MARREPSESGVSYRPPPAILCRDPRQSVDIGRRTCRMCSFKDAPTVRGPAGRITRLPRSEPADMIVGVPRESFPGERRVALVPGVIPNLVKAGLEVVVEAGAGAEAGYPDAEYTAKGAKILPTAPRSSPPPTSSSRCSAMARTTGPARRICRSSARDQVLIGFQRPLGSIETHPGARRPGSHLVLRRADAADDPRAEHGRAVLDGDGRRLQGGRPRRR